VVLGAFGFEAKSGKQVLEAKSFMAVTATGGAGVFRAQWAEEFVSIIPITTMMMPGGAAPSGSASSTGASAVTPIAQAAECRSNPSTANRSDQTRAAIEQVVGRYIRLHRYGGHVIGPLPFHEDHNPSLAVYPETGTFRCYR